jgi:hypothetical protein
MHAIAISAVVMLPRARWRFAWATPRVLSFAAADGDWGVPGLDQPFDGSTRPGVDLEQSDPPPGTPEGGSPPAPSGR